MIYSMGVSSEYGGEFALPVPSYCMLNTYILYYLHFIPYGIGAYIPTLSLLHVDVKATYLFYELYMCYYTI